MKKKSAPASPALIEADRVHHLVHDIHYQETLGKWMQDELDAATVAMANEDDPVRNAKSRGSYAVLRNILDRIQACLHRREANVEQLVNNLSEKANE